MSNIIKHADTLPDEFWGKAERELTTVQYNLMKTYIETGKHPLAPDTIASLFQLYLNGSSFEEIHRLNKAFPVESIYWASIKHDWEGQKQVYINSLQDGIRDKVIKAQLETTELLSTMLSAANKKNGDKLKKFLQTGDSTELKDTLNIENLGQLLKIVEGLQKLVQPGDAKQQKATVDINISNSSPKDIAVSGNTESDGSVTPDLAAQALAILTKKKSV